MDGYIISGISTEVGKTLVSAVLAIHLEADYWKPIEAGGSDTRTIQDLTDQKCYPPAYLLKNPISPHHAAELEETYIDPQKITLPQTSNKLIIEGSGGILTPLNDKTHLADVFVSFNLPWIIVSKHYLGSLNHTQLTIDWLKQRKQKIAGIIFNGTPYPEGENYLLKKTKIPLLGAIKLQPKITRSTIQCLANTFGDPILKN